MKNAGGKSQEMYCISTHLCDIMWQSDLTTTNIHPGHNIQLTCLKSATKVIRVPSPCLNSTVMESLSLSASRSSSVICPSAKRTLTFSSEADPRVTDTVSSQSKTVNRTKPGEIRLANIPDNPKTQKASSEGESTGITVADAVRLIPQDSSDRSPQNITAAPLSQLHPYFLEAGHTK